MPHIDDPCDANDEWEKRARRAMAWFTLRPYQRETVEAMIRGDRIVLDPKRRARDTYLERLGYRQYYMFTTGDKDVLSPDYDDRRYMVIGIDHADGPDRSVVSMDGIDFYFNGREYRPTRETTSEYDSFKPETLHRMLTDQTYKDKTLAMRRKVDRRFDRQQPPEWKGKRPR